MDSFYQAYFSQWQTATERPAVIDGLLPLFCRHLGASSCRLFVKKHAEWTHFTHCTPFHSLPISPRDEELEGWLCQPMPFHRQSAEKAVLWLPLQHQGTPIGLLALSYPAGSPCTDPDYLQPCILHLSAELKNDIAAEQPAGSGPVLLDMLQGLHDISFALWRAESIDDMLFHAVEQGKKVLKIDRIAIFLLTGHNRMKGTYGTDTEGNTVKEAYFESPIPPHWFIDHPQAQHGYLAIEENTSLYHDLQEIGFGWSAYTSLWDGDKRVGWIAYDNLINGRPLADYHPQLLKQFSFIVSQHLVRRQTEEHLSQLNGELEKRVTERTRELQQLNRQLEHTSRHDPLTQVPNRRVFDQTLPLEWRRAQRHQLPVSLLIIDVDHFKSFNDTYGHAMGDRCLSLIAQTLVSVERRAGALFARYGGEEFVILLPGQNAQAAIVAAENTLKAVRSLLIPVNNQEYCNVTVSVGISCMVPDKQSTADQLFNQADSALYKAKSLGRDAFFIYDD
ncbi:MULTISPECIES: GGDEF domain-containing protein [Photobacterium]|uniref:GGDEF domain-containing protein n=1 Tax=Photobacterium TaxID=657 RepID=UPI001C43EBF1|nr:MULTISPECIES: GGDEF domain-containing protein [Photobacterium]